MIHNFKKEFFPNTPFDINVIKGFNHRPWYLFKVSYEVFMVKFFLSSEQVAQETDEHSRKTDYK